MYQPNVNLRPYYIRQAGSGLKIFKVPRGQHGYGIFSSFFRKYGIDLIKFIGKKSFEPLKEVGQDIFVRKSDPKEAIKRGLKRTGKNIALGALDKLKDKVNQIGTGRRRKRAVRRKSSKKPKRQAKRRRVTKKKGRRRRGKKVNFRRNISQPIGDVFGY